MKKGEFTLKGFTIIEVSLVLAIAGLIFLMVFVALPALQRQQRDTRRRENIMSLISSVKKFQSNNRGALPTASSGGADSAVYDKNVSSDGVGWKNFYQAYLGDNFVDPSGGNYSLSIRSCGAGVSADAPCNGAAATAIDAISKPNFPFEYDGNTNTILIITQAACSGESAVGTSNPRKIAALYRLEGAGVYCYNS